MLRLEVFLVLLVIAKSQDLLGINYSFDVDFYRNFDNKRCDNESVWQLVRYEDLEIDSPFADSDKGIQAVGKSCASSFPIIFFGGTLEFNVYVQVISQKYRISIEVFDEEDTPITRYAYGRLSEGFQSGWIILSIHINNHAKGYINIRGRSSNNDIIIIDSFRYIPNNTVNYDYMQDNRGTKSDKDDEEIIFKYKDLREADNGGIGSSDLIDYDDGSGMDPNTTTPSPDPNDPERSSIWNPFTIFLLSFGILVVVAVIGVGAYHYGKVRARDRIPSLSFEEIIEPPRTITIPRIAGTSESRSDFMRFD